MKRESNIELLRIILMLMIILCHFADFAESEVSIFSIPNDKIVNVFFGYVFRQSGGIANNVFFLISGFFLINKKFLVCRIRPLLYSVFFYSILSMIFCVISYFTGYIDFHILKKILLSSIMPISSGYWWFITVYLILFCLSPVINNIFDSLSKRKFFFLLSFVYIFWYVLTRTFGYYYCMLQGAVVFYLIGAFIGKFYYGQKKYCILYFILTFISLVLAGVITTCFCPDGSVCLGSVLAKGIVGGVITPVTAITLFLSFKSLKISYNPVINGLSKHTFGVYLFHFIFVVRYFMWTCLEANGNLYLRNGWVPFTILYSFIIFVVGCIIDRIKELIFRKMKIFT